MKKISVIFFTALLLSGIFTSCKKSDSTPAAPEYGTLRVFFSNEVDGQPINLGPIAYRNAAGNQYSIDLLKYYVTNFTLVRSDGTEKNFKNYNLIDASLPASLSFTLDSVKNGDYTAVKFYLGVDQLRNHTGAQDGALDPVNGMIWSWNTGYIFFKHEGNYKDSTGTTKALLFHYGTDAALATVTVPITRLTVNGDNRRLYLKFNLNDLYNQPSRIDFNFDDNHMSTEAGDVFWISALKGNFGSAFHYSKAE